MKRLMGLALFMLVLMDCHTQPLDAALPYLSGQRFNGVASCASSTCHGSVQKFAESDIWHTEYIVWSRYDRHSRAYETLRNEKSRRIVSNLGIGRAYEEKICLDCHSSHVPKALRSEKFQLSDGVGCESCHGASENWLQKHTAPGRSHAANIKDGMYPLSDDNSQARVCLSCHLGNQNQAVTHDIIGAGHPRLSFELTTFNRLMPYHYDYDQDYIARKGSQSKLKQWIVGQINASREYLQLVKQHIATNHFIPEFSMFDCHACHHSMSNMRWQKTSVLKTPPGTLRLNDANMLMIYTLLSINNVQQATIFLTHIDALHKAGQQNSFALLAEINVFEKNLELIQQTLLKVDYSQKDTLDLIETIQKKLKTHEYFDYIDAEQALYALQALAEFTDKELIEMMLDCLKSENTYKGKCP